MTTQGPAEPCTGYQLLDDRGDPFERVHCNGCAEAATLRERLEAAEREAAGLRWAECGECEWFGPQGALVLEKSLISHCPVCFCTATLEAQPIDLALRRITNLKARATAAEGERDRLRGALTAIAEYEIDWREGPGNNVGVLQQWAENALAAIPHAEGEASAPPKETTHDDPG